MTGPHPIAPAAGLIALTVLVLPGDARDRYREEFRTELAELGPLAQFGQAASLLAGSISLRIALQERDVVAIEKVRSGWRCRVGLHHYVGVQDDNPEIRGQAYLKCTRCGKPKDPPRYGPMPPTVLGAAGS
ncbi:MAG TPA: hypothetical protein VES60_05515 [Nakamurella sp.]|nr:hypothetical protein [Nakamurella sp.]